MNLVEILRVGIVRYSNYMQLVEQQESASFQTAGLCLESHDVHLNIMANVCRNNS